MSIQIVLYFLSSVKSRKKSELTLDISPALEVYYRYRRINIDILKNILYVTFGVILGYFIKWLENLRRNKRPLSIEVDPNIVAKGTSGGGAFTGKRGCETRSSLAINFSNDKGRKTHIKIKTTELYPAEEIVFFKFKYRNGLYKTGVSFLHRELDLDRGDNTFRFPFEIECIKSFVKADLEKCKGIPMIFKIVYSVSPKFLEKSCEIELKDFFKNLL